VPSRQNSDTPDRDTATGTTVAVDHPGDDTRAVPVAVPLRTCVGCRSTDLRSILLRTVIRTDAAGVPALVVDDDRCLPGRGAWLHPDPGCLELAERRRAFSRALRCAGALDVQAVRRHLERTDEHDRCRVRTRER